MFELQFLSGAILGLMLGFALAYVYFVLRMKKRFETEITDERNRIEGDAMLEGINTGVALEAEAGWSKKPKTKKAKRKKSIKKVRK